MKKILVTSTDVMMLQFLVPHVFYLKERGYAIDVACSDVENHIEELKEIFKNLVTLNIVSLSRKPTDVNNFRGLSELKKIIIDGNYDLIWTNEPVMSIMTRLAAKLARSKAKVLYIAHGFHFYKGAPRKNWAIFYPIEKLFSWYTNEIITINQEDYSFAQSHFPEPKIVKMPGIGINTAKFSFSITHDEKVDKRKKLGVSASGKLIISVGELEKRKNHETAIRAFKQSDLPDTQMIICGIGSREKQIKELIKECNLQERVFLLGYRYDIRELCHSSDAFLFVTYQEGLSVALMEAMSAGLPCIISKIRGNVDLIDEGKGIFCNPHDVNSCAKALTDWYSAGIPDTDYCRYNQNKLKNYDFENTKRIIGREIEQLIGQ